MWEKQTYGPGAFKQQSAQPLFGMPTSHVGVPGFKSQPCSWFQLPANMYLRGSRWWLKYWVPATYMGDLDWVPRDIWAVIQRMKDKSLSLCLSNQILIFLKKEEILVEQFVEGEQNTWVHASFKRLYLSAQTYEKDMKLQPLLISRAWMKSPGVLLHPVCMYLNPGNSNITWLQVVKKYYNTEL